MTIMINTPNGHIGRPLTEALLAAGEQVVIIQRDPSKVADLAARGAKVIAGSVDDPATLDRAFAGVDAVFWLTPPAYQPEYAAWIQRITDLATAAATRHGVTRAVVLSSVGAHNDGNGPVSLLRPVEDGFAAALANVSILRPAYFMENFLRELGTIASQGVWYMPISPDNTMPMVATRDIAAVAAEELRGDWTGRRIRGVHGPADLSMAEAAVIFSKVLERDVQFVSVPLEAALDGMREAGLPEFVVEMYSGMLEGFENGRMRPAEPRTPETTTPTDLASFAATTLRAALG